MGRLTEWVKANVKEGANVAEFEDLESKLTFEGIKTVKEAVDFIQKNTTFKSAVDHLTTESIKTHDEKFQTDKLPKIIEEERKKLSLELNPPKTEAEQQLAELRDQVANMQAKEARLELEKLLRSKAKEYGYPEDRAEHFAIYGDKADEMLKADAEWLKQQVDSRVESEIKTRYAGQKPPNGGNPPAGDVSQRASLITQYNEIEASDDPNKGQKMLALKEQIRKLPTE